MSPSERVIVLFCSKLWLVNITSDNIELEDSDSKLVQASNLFHTI
jgi:hypothetical protein